MDTHSSLLQPQALYLLRMPRLTKEDKCQTKEDKCQTQVVPGLYKYLPEMQVILSDLKALF